MNIGLKFRDALFGKLGQTVREELDQLVASIVGHWLVGHNVDGSHSNAIGADAGDPTGSRYLRDDMTWVETDFADVATGETITGTWTFSTLPILGTLTGYLKGTAGALSAVTTIPGSDLTAATVTNAKLANMAQNTIKLRNTAGAGDPEDVAISSLTTNATPAAGDYFLMESGGNLRKVDWSTLPGAGGGEANTASNQGVGGVGLYDTKVGVDLQFRNINAGSSKVTVTLDAGNKEVDIDLGTVSADDLSDVILTAPAGGDFLRYLTASSAFVNTPSYTFSDGRPQFSLAGGSAKVADYTAVTSDYVVEFYSASALTLNLYTASGNGARVLWVINAGSNDVTIDPNGAELIDGASTKTLSPNQSAFIWSDGVNWFTIAEAGATSGGGLTQAQAINFAAWGAL